MAYIQIILDSCVPVGEESSNMDEEDLRQRLFELEKELALVPKKIKRSGQILNPQRTSFPTDKTASQTAK